MDAKDNLYGEHRYEGQKIDKWGHYVWSGCARPTDA